MHKDRSILIIAPDNNGISWAQEIQLIARKFNRPTILTGHVTLDLITTETVDIEVDIAYFVGHCSGKYAELSNGEKWEVTDMLGTFRHIGAELVFLNGCESARPGVYFKHNGIPATIAWLNKVVDKRALRVSAYYFDKLEEVDDYSEAFSAVNPRDGSLELFANGSYVHSGIKSVLKEMELNRKLIKFILFSLMLLAIAFFYETYQISQLKQLLIQQ